jgi:hypothetical protein
MPTSANDVWYHTINNIVFEFADEIFLGGEEPSTFAEG